MHFRITADTNQESGVGEVVDEISGPTRRHFVPLDYGSGAPRLCVVLMCRDPSLDFKRRIRFSKKDQTLYMDVMLHLSDLASLAHYERRITITERLRREVPEVMAKYKFHDFDQRKFESDLSSWLDSLPPNKSFERTREG